MAEKTIKTRIQSKHETEANWNKATNFVPLKGEIIIYDPDTTYDYPRIKVGDGKTNVISLKFVTEGVAKQITDGLAGKLSTTGKAADSDKLDGFDSSYFAVAETVNAALATKADSANVYTKKETGTQISNAINALDVSAPSASGNTTSFIDSISQTNGKISATKKTITSASTSATGIVKLNDAVNSTSTTTAATANAVKKAYDKAAEAAADAASRVATNGSSTMSGKLAMQMSNPHIHMKDTGYSTDWYFQAYQDQLAFGPTFDRAVKTDKTGNMTVPGTVTIENKVKLDYDSTSECLNFVFV